MKTSSLLLAVAALSFAAACSSSEGDGTGSGGSTTGTGGAGSGGESPATTGSTSTTTGSGGSGGGDCGETPLDCIGGEYEEDANGCTICNYFECAVQVCEDGESGECVGDDVVICDRGEGDCDVLDSDGNGLECPDGFVCADAEWTCGCPSAYRFPGTPCGEPGRSCEVPSELDCGPGTVTIDCTEDGWADADTGEGTGGGGTGGGDGAGGGDGCG